MKRLHNASRIVIKVGSALLVDDDTGQINAAWLASLADDIAMLIQQKKQVIIVTSGAVALGKSLITSKRQTLLLEEKQAAAACGQIMLNNAWENALGTRELRAGQILLTSDDTQQRKRYLNARSTIETLLSHDVIPIINENDSVATAELKYGDNDQLSARVAAMMGADMLILLSDVDGLYDKDPSRHINATHIPEVSNITDDIKVMAGDSTHHNGTGGMITKLMAAEIATTSGCHMMIAKGTAPHPVQQLVDSARHTLFLASESPLDARKHWIAASQTTDSTIMIDDGAAQALKQGNSLLSAGVTRIDGPFDRGDCVSIIDKNNIEIGKGLACYTSDEAKKITGKKSNDIEVILGYKGRDVLIHRDDMALIA